MSSSNPVLFSVLEFFYQSMGAKKPSRNRVVVLARQATYAGGIDFFNRFLSFLNV